MKRAVCLVLLLAAAGWLWWARQTPEPAIPPFPTVRSAHRPSDGQLLDRNGSVIHEMRIDPTRRRLGWVPLSEISPALQAAVIASEDRRFYQHRGVDMRALGAAGLRWMLGDGRRGASTISMQMAGLLRAGSREGGGHRTLRQKWRQMRMAWTLERQWSKAEILEAYLNLVTFRGELQGIAAASSVLFGKAPHGITDAEAAVLAALLRAPNAGPDTVLRRALALRAAPGAGGDREEISAVAARALRAPVDPEPRLGIAFHAARRLLEPAAGARTPLAPVRSTLDGALQRVAAETLRRHILEARDRRVQDGAVLVVDNGSGEVLAYVGGSGDVSSALHVDGVRARRQAGSSLKPFLYGLALDQRLITAATLLDDMPTDVPLAGGLYRPRNYDEQFKGLVTVRAALAGSVNVPAVKTLVLVGAEPFAERLRQLGLAGLTEAGDFYGPSLALGSADVSLWEMVNAYRTLANGGVWRPLRMRPDEPQAGRQRRLYSAETAFLVSHILADREARSGTFGLENPLATPFWAAVKTGTSKEMRDNWCIGYSRRYTVGVWVGNFSGAPMRDVSGVTGAAPVWAEIMAWLHRRAGSAAPKPPGGLRAARVDFPGGLEPSRVEWFLAGTEPRAAERFLAAAPPRILAPADGTLIALDPDIPAARQRVMFEAQTQGAAVDWRLDGTRLGPAAALVPWDPTPGRHRLSLVDETERPLDSVAFEVRGAPSASPDR